MHLQEYISVNILDRVYLYNMHTTIIMFLFNVIVYIQSYIYTNDIYLYINTNFMYLDTFMLTKVNFLFFDALHFFRHCHVLVYIL